MISVSLKIKGRRLNGQRAAGQQESRKEAQKAGREICPEHNRRNISNIKGTETKRLNIKRF